MTDPTTPIRGHHLAPPALRYQWSTQDQMDQLLEVSGNVAKKDELAAGATPVAGAAVTGSVKADTVTVTPATSVKVAPTNLLIANNFNTSTTVVAQDHWSWDGTDGNITAGCARVDCDGSQDDLVSNEIPVVVGETIEVAVQVKWSDLTYVYNKLDVPFNVPGMVSSGAIPAPTIALGIEKYRAARDADTGWPTFVDVGGYIVDTVQPQTAEGGWTGMAGTYVVESGVDQLRFRFHVTATAGVVLWDEAAFLKLDLIDDAAVPGVGQTVDEIVTNLYGVEGEGFTHNDAAMALANTSTALVSATARVAALEAEGYTGAVAGDDFSWSGEITANANWGGSYSVNKAYFGRYVANGNDAAWYPAGFVAGSSNQFCRFDWQGTDSVSTSDYQLIQAVLSSAPRTSQGYRSYVYIFGRVSADWNNYVYARIGSDSTYRVGYASAGVQVMMNSGACDPPGVGSIISLYCGDKTVSAPRNFTLKVGTSTICKFDEVGTGSQLGADYRKWGWGGLAEGGLYFWWITFLPTQATLPKINQWLAMDA